MTFGHFQHSSHYVLDDTSAHFYIAGPNFSLGGWGGGLGYGNEVPWSTWEAASSPPPPPQTGTRTMHEAKLQRLPHGEVIEKLVSIAVPDTAAEFLPDARQAA